jgi:predicted RNA binding protein YcfA (HicA-like mRNA interferase family)
MPKKVRELKAMLKKAGFCWRPGKGSHTVWSHALLPGRRITVAGNDGDDARKYLEKEVETAIERVESQS